MSKILGIVSEYNPFHNGHLYHLQKSKELVKADYTVCVMSGNFIQRGNTAVVDKWSRTKMAIENGIDLVIELPTLYAISSAENFAYGAISILNSLNIDYLSFGSECGNVDSLKEIASILNSEPEEYLELLNTELKKGLSFPKARENALISYKNISQDILSNPNNILGVEYLKSLQKLNSIITPITIKRENVEYNQEHIVNNFASATGIRNMISNNNISDVKSVVPENVYNILLDKINKNEIVPDISCFEKEILYILRRMTIKELLNLPEVSEGLENSIKKALNTANNIEDLLATIKSKRYTRTRIQRILLYALLNINKEDMNISYNTTPYIRVLGMNENGKKVISNALKNKPELNVVTSTRKSLDVFDSTLKNMLEKDILATDIYTLGYKNTKNTNLDFTRKIL